MPSEAGLQTYRQFGAVVVVGVVMLSWVTAVVLMLVHKNKNKNEHKSRETRRDRKSSFGIALQSIGFAVTWGIRRKLFTPIVPLPLPIELVLSLAAIALAIGSVWIAIRAIRTLGEEWSFGARLIEGHRLVQTGPYSIVRNPIYAGMFGMQLATGLTLSHWIGLSIATPIFLAGTMIRVRAEEKLLREAFGAEFEKYAARVPALVPLLF